MILLVDVGNTRIKWWLWEPGRTGPGGSLLHKGLAPTELGEQLWRGLKHPSKVMIANVAGAEMATALRDWIQQAWQLEPRFATMAATGYGVTNAYAIPSQMGVDRWVAMIGARAMLSQSCCIVDCGTAVTVDALTARGQHLGGVIFPGVRLMREALYRDTRQIPAEDQGQPTVFGQSTRDCVWGGTTYAVAAAIDGIAERMEEKLPGETQRLLTGGDAELLSPYLRGRYRLEPELIFQGLLVMAGQRPAS